MSDSQIKILAQAIYDIRILLSGYLGSQHTGETVVREAAHLAYASHNEALAILENRSFDPADAIKKIEAVDRMFHETFAEHFASHSNKPPQQNAPPNSLGLGSLS
jgi:hypothetical protein